MRCRRIARWSIATHWDRRQRHPRRALPASSAYRCQQISSHELQRTRLLSQSLAGDARSIGIRNFRRVAAGNTLRCQPEDRHQQHQDQIDLCCQWLTSCRFACLRCSSLRSARGHRLMAIGTRTLKGDCGVGRYTAASRDLAMARADPRRRINGAVHAIRCCESSTPDVFRGAMNWQLPNREAHRRRMWAPGDYLSPKPSTSNAADRRLPVPPPSRRRPPARAAPRRPRTAMAGARPIARPKTTARSASVS